MRVMSRRNDQERGIGEARPRKEGLFGQETRTRNREDAGGDGELAEKRSISSRSLKDRLVGRDGGLISILSCIQPRFNRTKRS